jgi:hypothetical protein
MWTAEAMTCVHTSESSNHNGHCQHKNLSYQVIFLLNNNVIIDNIYNKNLYFILFYIIHICS